MNKTNKDIRDRFDFFDELLRENKVVLKKTIQLEAKNNNTKWLIGNSNIEHKTINENISFLVERSKRDAKYGIKLRCKSLTDEPFFRFDSDGPAHRNNDPSIPLDQQSITTPHFNTFLKSGKPVAYKNKALERENDASAVADDINFGVSLFCMETKSLLETGDFPCVIDKLPELEFKGGESINFDHIDFK